MIVGDLTIWTIRGYQKLISRYLPPMCRFHPTCSSYAVEAVRVHGVARGSLLASWRIMRCNPLNPGGHDPVPPPRGAPPSGNKDPALDVGLPGSPDGDPVGGSGG